MFINKFIPLFIGEIKTIKNFELFDLFFNLDCKLRSILTYTSLKYFNNVKIIVICFIFFTIKFIFLPENWKKFIKNNANDFI